ALPTSFSFNDAATTEISTLSLHDALPISGFSAASDQFPALSAASAIANEVVVAFGAYANNITWGATTPYTNRVNNGTVGIEGDRSEEHTSELQSRSDLVCRLLLEKKKNLP